MVFGKKRRIAEIEQSEDDIFDDNNPTIIIDDDNNDATQNTNRCSSFSGSAYVDANAKSKPLLTEVTFHGAAQGQNPGGAKSWTCNHCNKKFSSSYTRIHYHFFGAPPGKKAEIARCALLNDRVEYEKLRKKVQEAEKKGVCSTLKSSTLTKPRASKSSSQIEDAFKTMDRDMVDMKVMDFLCANGISFNILRSPQFHEMISAVNRGPKGYKAPSYEKARTSLLDECKRKIEKELIPIKDTWHSHGVSIISDGWTSVKNRPLINIIAENSRGAMFLYADDFSGTEKTGVAIGKYLLKAIEEVGSSNVLQVVTDNAANCKLAGKEVEKVHKHIFWSPCVNHTLNLIFKDFANEFEWFRDTYKEGKMIVKYFVNHNHALSMFRAQSKLELLKVAKTRFASHYILLKRLVDCREALATTIVLAPWKSMMKYADDNTKRQGALVAEKIGSDQFWDDVEAILNITKPLYYLIKFCDGEGQKMGEIYEKMDNMVGEIKDIMRGGPHFDKFPSIQNIILNRWEKMNIPMHCLGFALTPRFYDPQYLAKRAPGGTLRKSPNQDKEVIVGVMEAFEKISENAEEARLLREQYAVFHSRKGLYGSLPAQTDAVTMDAIDWWSTYGAETPELAEVAMKVLSQPISSSSAERNWSTYSFILNAKRNRLNSLRADKLVFIHSNIRLLSRFTESYKVGPFKNWDMSPDETYIDDSIVRLEDMCWSSLEHEPPSTRVDKDQDVVSSSTYSMPIFTTPNRQGTRQTQISTYARRVSSQSDKGKDHAH